ncbi:transcription factor GTE12-like [Vicia villosa]|uniref:transcription factor GTE12-like n=1 Tax=Vicia villosa TaxID=3911 RepID=UPI00273C3B43|nr:transcription factor GTE12-like [Vicia villosa]
MNSFKKQQCFVTLKRLMINPDGKDFKNAMDSKASTNHDSKGEPLMNFETVKLKLEKGLYLTIDQFASDVRNLFYNTIVLHQVNQKTQRIAMKLSHLFEMKWKSLEEKWEAEKQMKIEEKLKEELKKNVTKSRRSEYGERNKRKFEYDKENQCSNLSNKKVKKELVVDKILASQRDLFGYNNVSMERKKQKKDAQVMIQNMKRTVFIDEDLFYFKELERLCGHSLRDCNKISPLKKFAGLVLKDEFMGVTDLDEEKFLNRYWEEGEIIILD